MPFFNFNFERPHVIKSTVSVEVYIHAGAISREQAFKQIDYANSIWEQAGVSFHLNPEDIKLFSGSEYLRNNGLFGYGLPCSPASLDDFWNKDTPGKVRIHFVPNFSKGDSDYSTVRGFMNPYNDRVVIISSAAMNWNTLSHELGHVFGLGHLSYEGGYKDYLMYSSPEAWSPKISNGEKVKVKKWLDGFLHQNK